MHFKDKKIVISLGLAVIFLMVGCHNDKQVSDENKADDNLIVDTVVTSSDTLYTEVRMMVDREVVLARVKDIYSLIKSDFAAHGGAYDSELYDRSFCSKSWNKLLMNVRSKEARTNNLFSEINYWSMTRESGVTVSFDEFVVTNMYSGSELTASVNFMVYEADKYTPARIDLIFEDGRWVIDNFYNLRYMIDVKNSMWDFLEEETV